VTQDESHVSVGGLLETCQNGKKKGRSGKKDDRGEIKHVKTEVTAGGKHNMCACKEACTRKVTAGRKNNTCTGEEDLMLVGLGFL
jgi:hypothetical protein